MTENLKDFYLTAPQVDTDTSSDASVANEPTIPTVTSETQAQRIIESGKLYDELAQSLVSLSSLMDKARNGSEAAISEIIQRFATETIEVSVSITSPLKDSRGNAPKEFGVLVIEDEADWAKLMEAYEVVAGYLPGIEVHNVPTTRKGKQLAVVMGITARAFNAVLAAERRKKQIQRSMDSLDGEIRRARKEMNVDKGERLASKEEEEAHLSTTPSPSGGSGGGKGKPGASTGTGGKGGGAAKG